MAHGRLVFVIPASSTDAFEEFFNHVVRLKWDTLLRETYVEGGGSHPSVGSISVNKGRGWKGGFSMRTRDLTYDPPRHSAAEMVSPIGPFALWAASMRFRDRNQSTCELTYTYSLRLRPKWFGWLLDPISGLLFAWETKRRFKAMSRYVVDQRVKNIA